MTKSPTDDSAGEIVIGSPSEVLQRAAAHYNKTEYAAAAAICREVVAQDSDNAEALFILGHIAGQTGEHDAAVSYFVRAVSLAPTDPRFSRGFALALERANRLDHAIQAWQQYLAATPDDLEGQLHLARLHDDAGDFAGSAAAYATALALAPEDRQTRFALAVARQRAGDLEGAVESYEALRGTAAHSTDAEIENNLGVCLARLGRREEARRCYDKALALRPEWAEGHLNLANLLRQTDRFEEAVEHYETALAASPDDYRIHGSFALARMNMNDVDGAVAGYRRALELAPEDAELRKGLGIAQLLGGDLREGWANYEARLLCEPVRAFAIPRWRGEDLAGGSLLVYAEQGFGDTLQFARYLPAVAARANAGEVVFECQRGLCRLLSCVAGIDRIVPRGEPLPETDRQVPLLSLPGIFETALHTIPAPKGYLQPPAASDRPKISNGGARIGVVWKGNPSRLEDERRSCPLAALAPIVELAGPTFVSLQTDAAPCEADWLSARGVADGAETIEDFADTAAVVSRLDLIVTVDTASAHLAGALGKSVWVMLGYAADWRYLVAREDSPWYPSMRLFRQESAGDWDGVIGRVTDALRREFGL